MLYLGGRPLALNDILLEQAVYKKVVMVTGAGGSIGSELCRQDFPHATKPNYSHRKQ